MLENNGYILLFGGCLVWCICIILHGLDVYGYGWKLIRSYINKLFKKKK